MGLGLLGMNSQLSAQDLDKQDQILIGKTPVAKLERIKRSDLLGMVNDFNVKTLDGSTTLLSIHWDEDVRQDDESLDYWYILRQGDKDSCLVALSKLGAPKAIARVVGANKLVANNAIDAAAWAAFRTKGGKRNVERMPRFDMAARDRSWPITLDLDKECKVLQASTKIATYRYLGESNGMARYDFFLPNGTKAATIEFAGGNNMQAFTVQTYKDGSKRSISSPQADTITAASASEENPYLFASRRIAKWLVDNQYI